MVKSKVSAPKCAATFGHCACTDLSAEQRKYGSLTRSTNSVMVLAIAACSWASGCVSLRCGAFRAGAGTRGDSGDGSESAALLARSAASAADVHSPSMQTRSPQQYDLPFQGVVQHSEPCN